MKNFNPRLYFIADPAVCAGRDVLDIVRQAAAGGATMVQLRNKTCDARTILAQAKNLKEILRPFNIPLIINDRADIALAADADGVHLGQGDLPPEAARALLGPGKIIGITAFEAAHFKAIDLACVDYAGTGPFYPTRTKPDKAVLGPQRFKALAALSPVPVVAIGGITPENAADALACGAAGVAMMRSISEAANPREAAEAFSKVLKPRMDAKKHE